MGKVEILTLIAGVVLSIALALIVVPLFSNSEDVITKHTIKSNLIQFKNILDLKGVDGSIYKYKLQSGNITYLNLLIFKSIYNSENKIINSSIDIFYKNDHSYELIKISIRDQNRMNNKSSDINLKKLFENDLIIKDGETTLKDINFCKSVNLSELRLDCNLQ